MKFLITNFFHIKYFRKYEKIVILFTLFYVLLFAFYDYITGKRGNIESLLYIFSLLLLLNAAVYFHKKFQFPRVIFFGLSIFLLLHILGGVIQWNSERLYEKYFFFNFIRYDNFIHLGGSFLTVLVLNILFEKHYFFEKNYNFYLVSLVLMSLGVGVINEIAEFFGVAFFHIETRVGDYYNNAIDLVYNSIGSLLALLFLSEKRKK